MEDLSQYNLGNAVSLITNISLSSWGNTFTFECVYDPVGRKPYKMIFTGCNNIQWSIHELSLINDSEADVIDIQLIQDTQLTKAIFFTDIFELSFLYESLEIEKTW